MQSIQLDLGLSSDKGIGILEVGVIKGLSLGVCSQSFHVQRLDTGFGSNDTIALGLKEGESAFTTNARIASGYDRSAIGFQGVAVRLRRERVRWQGSSPCWLKGFGAQLAGVAGNLPIN